jgi:hypothetical protein
MAYPTSPVDGQIYGNKKYNSTKNVWENCLQLPIGFIYTQLPGESDPATLYGGNWTDISSSYAGSFFRVAGGNSTEFESHLTVSTATTTVITFTTVHGLSVGSLLRSSSGEVRSVSVVNSTTQVTVSTAYSTVPSGNMIIGQGDAIRNITGSFYNKRANGLAVSYSGALSFADVHGGSNGATGSAGSGGTVYFNASSCVPTAEDNRPANFTIKIWKKTV